MHSERARDTFIPMVVAKWFGDVFLCKIKVWFIEKLKS